MRALALVVIAACGKSADAPAPAPTPTPTPTPAPTPKAEGDLAAQVDGAIHIPTAKMPTPYVGEPVDPVSIAGEVTVAGKLVDVTTLSPKVVLHACGDVVHYGWNVTLVSEHAHLLEVAVSEPRYLPVGQRYKLWADDYDTGNYHHGPVPADVTAFPTDAAGKAGRTQATGGSVVVRELGSKVDVELDAVFGKLGHVKARLASGLPRTTGPCAVR